MPHPTKTQMLEGHPSAVVAANDDFVASFDDLADLLPNILGFLLLEDIMRSRRINKKTREAAKTTIVPLGDFSVDRVEKYTAMNVMTEALPNLQQINLYNLGIRHEYSDGEDPYEVWADETADYPTYYDIGIISNFSKLRILTFENAHLNGRYPFLFNSFPLLQKLSIDECYCLKWDLEMLAGMPSLKEFGCYHNDGTTGNINSLRVLKDKLEKVIIFNCENIEGNFMDLADFPHLRELNLELTAVKGDIRDIGVNGFLSLEKLTLPKTVYGGKGYEFQRITDAPDLARAVYLLKKKRPTLSMLQYWFAKLSEDSPDWYETPVAPVQAFHDPPFEIQVVEAGSRIGYRWTTKYHRSRSCEVNWLDPEPDRESVVYADYVAEMQGIDLFFGGFHQPPTEEEYIRLIQEERFAGQERAIAHSLRLLEELRRQREH
jgi:hypothetical protein